METLNFSDLPLHNMVTLAFYATTIIYLFFTAILYYHWKEYSVDNNVSKITTVVYLITTIPLMLVLGLLVLII